MNNIEKAGVILAGILIVVGIAYYALPNISGSSAFGLRPGSSPLLGSSDSLACNIYVADSSMADDLNDGLTLQTPVRTIRRSFDIANTCKTANIKFLEESYNVLSSDILINNPPVNEIEIGGLVESINIEPYQSNNYTIYTSLSDKTNMISLTDVDGSNQYIDINIHEFIFDDIGFRNKFKSNVNIAYSNNVFNVRYPVIGGVVIEFTNHPIQNTNLTAKINDNIFNMEYKNRAAILMSVISGFEHQNNHVEISNNEFVFNQSIYEADANNSETNGILIGHLAIGSDVNIMNNTFVLEDGYSPYSKSRSLIGISMLGGNQSAIDISGNVFSLAAAIRVGIHYFPLNADESYSQNITIINNYEAY